MSPATQPQPEEQDHSKHHIVVTGQEPRGYGIVSVLTTIVGALTDDGSLREYWWDVTPDVAPISKIDSAWGCRSAGEVGTICRENIRYIGAGFSLTR